MGRKVWRMVPLLPHLCFCSASGGVGRPPSSSSHAYRLFCVYLTLPALLYLYALALPSHIAFIIHMQFILFVGWRRGEVFLGATCVVVPMPSYLQEEVPCHAFWFLSCLPALYATTALLPLPLLLPIVTSYPTPNLPIACPTPTSLPTLLPLLLSFWLLPLLLVLPFPAFLGVACHHSSCRIDT